MVVMISMSPFLEIFMLLGKAWSRDAASPTRKIGADFFILKIKSPYQVLAFIGIRTYLIVKLRQKVLFIGSFSWKLCTWCLNYTKTRTQLFYLHNCASNKLANNLYNYMEILRVTFTLKNVYLLLIIFI